MFLVGRERLGIELAGRRVDLFGHRFFQKLDVGELSPYRQTDRYGDRNGLRHGLDSIPCSVWGEPLSFTISCPTDNSLTLACVVLTRLLRQIPPGRPPRSRKRCCASIISQEAALEALQHGAEDVVVMRGQYRLRRNFIVKSFNEIGLPCHWPNGVDLLWKL